MNGGNNGGFNDLFNDNGGMAESVYINNTNAKQMGGGGSKQISFVCSCGAVLADQEQVHNHSFECISMQQEGFASFAQGLHSLVAPMAMQTAQAQERKLNNLRAIFQLYIPDVDPATVGKQIQQRPPKKQNPFNKFEEDKDDSMQIGDKPMAEVMFGDSNQIMEKQVSQNSGGLNIQADNMDDMLSFQEKERASTIYK